MNVLNKILISFIFLSSLQINAQERSRFMFYNVENLFDTFDDSLKNDEEFTPNGDKFWSKRKYNEKLNHIYKVITAVGEWNSPDLIGLCEVENRLVLEELLNFTPLNKLQYDIIHFESPDRRGIDVALLYNKKKFSIIKEIPIPVVIDGRPTRDILYAKMQSKSEDTIHIFINHWPSRWGGQINSEPRRIAAATKLKVVVDSIFETDIKPNILIAGDLNDYPTDKSIREYLKARSEFENIEDKEIYNISYYLQEEKGQWSHKYKEEQGILDQILVSGNLLNSKKFYINLDNAAVFKAPFLLEKDESTFGDKTYRTYIGFKYNGGFSDHLPVYIDLFSK
jgi:predicted extracellular nuclease